MLTGPFREFQYFKSSMVVHFAYSGIVGYNFQSKREILTLYLNTAGP